MIKVASQQQMKHINMKTVYRLIKSTEQISRAQLAGLTKLSPTTISFLVEELIDKGLVVEKSPMKSTKVGRKAITLEVNVTHNYVIGVELNQRGISGAVFNLKNDPIIVMKGDFQGGIYTEDNILDTLVGIIHKLNTAAQVKFANLVAIGVSVSGVLDNDRKIMIVSSTLNMKNIHFYQRLEIEFRVPIFIEDETLLSAIAERELHAVEKNPFIYLSINEGLGGSVIINGKYLEGVNQAHLELGHMSLDINGPRCPCGNYGCFELFVSIRALIEQALISLPHYPDSIIHEWTAGNPYTLDELMIAKAAQENDPLSLFVIREIGRRLGNGLVNLIHLFNPAMIVIGGKLSALGNELLLQAQTQVNNRALPSFAENCEIVFAAHKGNVSSNGAAIYALDKALELHLL